MSTSIMSFFEGMKDPRIKRRQFHSLENIVFITIAGVMSGCSSWNDLEDYRKSKKDWLDTILNLENGIPSHDTFNRFFQLLDPLEFEQSFLEWVKSIVGDISGDIIAIDGKTNRGSKSRNFLQHTYIVSEYSNTYNLTLGQVKTEEKSNEITAIPELLKSLDIEKSTITIDAMGCQKKIAKTIVDKKADYILAVKENQKSLLNDILSSFSLLSPQETYLEKNFGHGRIETRKYSVISNLQHIHNKDSWCNLQSIIRVESERFIKATGEIQQEQRFYISTLDDAKQIGKGIRGHWSIENKLHWILDVAFNEDSSAKRAGNASANFSIINKIYLNLAKKNERKIGIKRKRNLAGWDNQYLMELLKF